MDSPQVITARVVAGHRVASGGNKDPRFPGGTLRMQAPFFRELGLDISRFHSGTVNVSIAPLVYRVVNPVVTFRQVKWHPVEPAEDFSFFDLRVQTPAGVSVSGYIYYPSPETKPEHFQQPDVLELLVPFLDDLHYGMNLAIEVPSEQMMIGEPHSQAFLSGQNPVQS